MKSKYLPRRGRKHRGFNQELESSGMFRCVHLRVWVESMSCESLIRSGTNMKEIWFPHPKFLDFGGQGLKFEMG
jgi:hypothetical protein